MTDVVYLVDVDNTLLDNDAVIADLRAHLRDAFGAECERRYWEIFEELRRELGYADYLGALQRYRIENPTALESLARAHRDAALAREKQVKDADRKSVV